MRTISQLHFSKIASIAEEADIQGKSELAELLTNQIEKNPVRANHEGYTYTHDSFDKDVKTALWDIIIRAQDYHDTVIDSLNAEKLVEIYAKEIVGDIRKIANLKPVGKFEPKIPGEIEEE